MLKRYIRDNRSPVPTKPLTSMIMSKIRAKNTKPEQLVRRLLKQSGVVGCKFHLKDLPGRPDVCIPSKKQAIFVHGCFWHRCRNCDKPLPKNNRLFWKRKFLRNLKRDKEKIRLLKIHGWKAAVFWECDIKKRPHKILREITSMKISR